MDYQIVFFDVDGTLTSPIDGSIFERTKSALNGLKNQGVILVAATSRPLFMCDDIRSFGIDVFITSKGRYVKHGERVIHKVPMKPETLQSVMGFADKEKHALSFYTEELSMSNVQNPNILTAFKQTLSLNDFPRINKAHFKKESFYCACLQTMKW